MRWALGLDPGGASGIVLAQVAGREVLAVPEWHELNQKDTVMWLDQLFRLGTVDIAVCETFKPRGGRAIKFQPYSLELIGYLRGLCWTHDVPVVWQDPLVKNQFHARALEQFPEVGRGGGGHARDAMAHVLGFATLHNGNRGTQDEG